MHRVTRHRDIQSPASSAAARAPRAAIALKEIEPFICNGEHLQSGKPLKKFGDMRSREILANWLVCVAIKMRALRVIFIRE
jgi:hypothetical protein